MMFMVVTELRPQLIDIRIFLIHLTSSGLISFENRQSAPVCPTDRLELTTVLKR